MSEKKIEELIKLPVWYDDRWTCLKNADGLWLADFHVELGLSSQDPREIDLIGKWVADRLNEAANGWIPVSERLPEEDKEVIWQYKQGGNIFGYRYNKEQVQVSGGTVHDWRWLSAFIAWREKPAPYEGEK